MIEVITTVGDASQALRTETVDEMMDLLNYLEAEEEELEPDLSFLEDLEGNLLTALNEALQGAQR